MPGDLGLAEDLAKARGTLLHLLLERLPEHPPADWQAIAEGLTETLDLELLEEARRVLSAPDLARFFAPETLAEVDLVASYDGRVIKGTIDRLLVTPDDVLAVDFKSNATVPDDLARVPEGLLRQMGAYAHGLAQIYPDRRIRTALLWTRSARLMELPADLTAAALTRAEFVTSPGDHLGDP